MKEKKAPTFLERKVGKRTFIKKEFAKQFSFALLILYKKELFMIRNLVFDFGQVLVRFLPEEIAGPDFPDPADRAFACKILFDRALWNPMDKGELDEEEAFAQMLPRLPERFQAPGKRVMEHWFERLPPVPGMQELVRRVKKDYGVRTYLLSNISRRFTEHLDLFPLLSELDGCVFSGKIGITKPSPEIFSYLCRTYDLNPAETLFVDDQPRNIEGAKNFGLQTYLFDGNAAVLSAYLDQILQ